ncbi:Are2p [Saccharomyces cerevisiae x Saccharomyces kudriavzevii VIN7]|uniref:O-acyltransferase n=1 Tax=Saccharomyces cerevisiae x Saccharomyces kudriavzevii (strain VIN7) TaxID=1095631 RepID=H0H0I0_SACCK|nr:Are2p [Saccharomyces cerevisiae x Saccharomyces kudriavzevii VIN7]
MDKRKGLLESEQFLRIQKLNAGDAGRRQSITVDNEDELYGLDSASNSPVGEHTTTTVTQNHSVVASNGDVAFIPGTTTEGDTETVTQKVVETDERVFKTHVKTLSSKEKTRYRRGSPNFTSYFDDMSFEHRPSILDGSVNEPFQTQFVGPTLEKEIRRREKELVTMRRNLHQRESSSDAVASPEKNDSAASTAAAAAATKETVVTVETTALSSNFSGLYVAFWMAIAFGAAKALIDYYYQHDGSFKDSEILKFMTTNLSTVASVDLIMYLSTYFVVGIQYLCKWGVLKWGSTGWIFTSIYELLFVVFYMYLTENILKLHWLSKIFLFLHSLVLLMKMHSFAFYNGYLWGIKEELQFSKRALAKYKDSIKDSEVIDALEKSCDFCSFELNSQSLNDQKQKFPNNISACNFFWFTMFPTLIYQIEYPRTKEIRWIYVLEKICAIFGTIFLMMIDAQILMHPVAMRAVAVRNSEWTGILDRLLKWIGLLVDIVPGFIVMYILDFYLIWDAILNCVAELTRFGDRYFYGDWWNCVSWADFSRIWNIPVHKFLLRHVYHSSMSSFQLNKSQATLMTFFLSSVVHELAMYVIFKKLRFYLFFFQMMQVPLVALTNTKFMRDKTIIGNVIFWLGICMGPSVMCTLYLTF